MSKGLAVVLTVLLVIHTVRHIARDIVNILQSNGYVLVNVVSIRPVVKIKPVPIQYALTVVVMYHIFFNVIGIPPVFKINVMHLLARSGGIGVFVSVNGNTVIAKRQATMLMTYKH